MQNFMWLDAISGANWGSTYWSLPFLRPLLTSEGRHIAPLSLLSATVLEKKQSRKLSNDVMNVHILSCAQR